LSVILSLKNLGAYAQINEAYNQSVPKRNSKPGLMDRKLDRKTEPNIWRYYRIYKQYKRHVGTLTKVAQA